MGFREDIYDYTGRFTGLIGDMPNDAGFSSGNPLVETGTACLFLKKLGLLTIDDAHTKVAAIAYCLPKNGFFSKLPGAMSRASHDDVIGIVAAYATVGFLGNEFLKDDIIEYGKKHWWVLSTDGKLYWDAVTKPWHYAFYMLAAEQNPGVIAKTLLAGAIVADGLFNKDSSSDAKLIWMMLETIGGKSKIVDYASRFWYKRMRKTWGSVNNIFKAYFGPNHVFTIYSGGF